METAQRIHAENKYIRGIGIRHIEKPTDSKSKKWHDRMKQKTINRWLEVG